MLNIIKAPGFEETFKTDDPLSKLPLQIVEEYVKVLDEHMDKIIRTALSKAMSPETLALYTQDNKAIPGLDLNIELRTYNTRHVSIVFRGQELGHATFTTKLVDSTKTEHDGVPMTVIRIEHTASDVWFREEK